MWHFYGEDDGNLEHDSYRFVKKCKKLLRTSENEVEEAACVWCMVSDRNLMI